VRPESLDFLRRLLDTPSPSGFEHEGQKVWLAYVKPFADRVWNDAYGNCFAELSPPQGGSGAPTVAVMGHADEIGLMVNHIDAQGFVYCRAIGGIDAAAIVGHRVQFRSSAPGVTSPVVGLIGATAVHLKDKDADKVRKVHELFIDIGATDQAAAQAKLRVGDPGVLMEGSLLMGDGLIVARALDNRIGTFVAAETLRLLAERRASVKVRVVAVSTVQEEVGLHGATMVAESLRPQVALVTDVGHATDSPGISAAQHGQFKMGAGPKIAVGGAMQPQVVERLVAAAEAASIPLQRSATPGRSGTDTDAVFLRAGGIPSGLLSLPIRYMHTPVELASLKDLEQIPQVFAGFAGALTGRERFMPEL
jgi:putative aminopeptidase FrvX